MSLPGRAPISASSAAAPPPAYAAAASYDSGGSARSARDHLDRFVSIGMRSWRFKWYAALVLLLGTTLSLAAALLRERQYTSETLIVYREGIGTRTISGSEATVDAQQKLALKLKELVLSRTTLEKLITEYHLYPQIMDKRGAVDAVDEMRKQIAFHAKDGETFGLSFTGNEPHRVQELTARLARELLEEHSKSRIEAAGETKEFLDDEKRRSDEDLRVRESALATFIAKHPEFAKESNGAGAGTQSGIAVRAANSKSAARSEDPQLNALEREAQRLQARLGVPTARKADRDIDPKLAAVRSDAENDLKIAQKDLADKAAQFTEEHPDVRAAKNRVKNAEAKLRRANEAIAASDAEATRTKPEAADDGVIDKGALEAELKKAQEAISTYKRKKAASPDGADTGPSAASGVVTLETDWTRLNREVADARERNQQLESRQFKASILENAVTAGRNAQMIIVDPAYKPTHPNKGRTQVVGAGLAVSFILAMLLALTLTLLDDRIYDRIDLDGLHVAPILGVVPRADGKRDHRG